MEAKGLMLILEFAAGVWLAMMAVSGVVTIARKIRENDEKLGLQPCRPNCADCRRRIPNIELAVYVSELKGYLCAGCIGPVCEKTKRRKPTLTRHRY
jgi:hypothetical protein